MPPSALTTATKPQSLTDFTKDQIRNRVKYHTSVAMRVTKELHQFCQEMAMQEGVRESDLYRHAIVEYAIARGFDTTASV